MDISFSCKQNIRQKKGVQLLFKDMGRCQSVLFL